MLEATRPRATLIGEGWTLALLTCGALLVGSLAVRELRVVPRAFPASPSASVVEAVPAAAMSVPALIVGTAHGIKVGETLASAVLSLGSTVELVRRAVEAGPLGAREVRSYRGADTEFILVAEPFEYAGEPRVSAIYIP